MARPLSESYADIVRGDTSGGADYDLAAYIAKYGKPDQSKGQHLTDEFKRPNHMTFSSDSVYSTPDQRGGQWIERGGKWHFYASPFNLKMHSPDELSAYFAKVEPNAVLHLPGMEFY